MLACVRETCCLHKSFASYVTSQKSRAQSKAVTVETVRQVTEVTALSYNSHTHTDHESNEKSSVVGQRHEGTRENQ